MFHYDRDLKPRKKSYYAFSKNYPGRRTGTKYAIGESRARHKRERNKNILFGVSLVVLFAVVFVFAAPIASAFNSSGDPVLAGYAVTGLRIYFLGFWCAGLNIVSAAFFSASGRSAQGFAISLLRGVIAIPPVLLALTAFAGIGGVWATFPTVEAIVAVLTLVCVWRVFRRPVDAAKQQ